MSGYLRAICHLSTASANFSWADVTSAPVGEKEDETAMVTCETRDRLRHVPICYRDKRIEESASDCFKLFAQAYRIFEHPIRASSVSERCLVGRC
jgi:hypothetical protein